jgi:hypothetical protein
MQRRSRSTTLLLAALAAVGVATECRTTQGPPRARPLVEGDPLDAWIARTESARGLTFIRRPQLEIVDPGAAALQALRDANAIPLVVPSGLLFTRPLERTAADRTRDRVVAAAPIAEDEVRVALAFLLDAQHHPNLVGDAERSAGDVGVALRALVAASALATANGGLGSASEGPLPDAFEDPRIEIEADPDGDLFGPEPVLAAQGFLRAIDDREAAFRAPPLSTEQILRPQRWVQSDRPARLVGPPPLRAGCTIARDESVGVYALARGLIQRGGSVASQAFRSWYGDRVVAWRCDDGRTPWIYVAVLDDEDGARRFADAAALLLPTEWPEAEGIGRRGRRAFAFHGVGAAEADAFATRLVAIEIKRASDVARGAGTP